MTTSELLIQITNNEQATVNELENIIALQEELMNPKITFTVNNKEMTVLDINGYWDTRLGPTNIYSEDFESEITNVNGYATCVFYTIKDSDNKYVKYGDRIKNGEAYKASSWVEFTIVGSDGTSYHMEYNGPLISVSFDELYNGYDPTRFSISEDQETVYFTPTECGPTYYIYDRMGTISGQRIGLGETIYMTLLEGGLINE